MKVGSIVTPLVDFSYLLAKGVTFIPIMPEKGKEYIVSYIDGEILKVEEVTSIQAMGQGWDFRAKSWRELQPPMDLTEFVEQCKLQPA